MRSTATSMTVVVNSASEVVQHTRTSAENQVRSEISSFGICGGQSVIQTGCSPSTSVFSCQHHPTNTVHSYLIHLLTTNA